MKDIVVLYHNDCPDGFSAAWVAWKKFGDKADYIGINHHDSIYKGLKNKDIFMLDIIYPKEIMRELIGNNKNITGIDHHKTSSESIKLVKDRLYDMDHSGAFLTWKYFFPKKNVPMLVRYIEDRDMWNWKIKNSEEILLYIDTFDFSFKNWDIIYLDLEDEAKREEYYEKGSVIRRYETKMVERLIDNGAELVEFEGYKTYIVNAPGSFASHIGNILSKKYPPIALIWNESSDVIKVSLRSDGSVDVADLAKKYDGGGHKAASAFSYKIGKKAPWKRLHTK